MAGRRANATINIHKLLAEAFLPKTIIIFCFLITGLDTGIDKGSIQWITHIITSTDSHRPFIASVFSIQALMILKLFKIGQAVLVVPASRTIGFPFVIIMGIATHIDHAVNRGGTTHNLSPRTVHAPII